MQKRIIIFLMLFIVMFANVYALELEDDVVLNEDTTLTEQIIIPEGSAITVDLNERTLTASSNGVRRIINRGNLTIKNGTIINENSEAYGIIDNYGIISLNDITLNDAGCGDGSTLKNRGGIIVVKNSVFNNTGINNGNAGIYSDGTLTIVDTIFSSISEGAYPLIVNSGTGNITDVTVTGSKGGMAVNSGTVVINSGTFTGGAYYGIWITNDGGTDVTIKNGKFIGKKYGLYAAVDDGLQDEGNVGIKILGGTFQGETKAAALVNDDKSDKSWGMDVTGGTFTTSVSQYVKENYQEYMSDDAFIVAPTITAEMTSNKYIQLGKSTEINIIYLDYLGEIVDVSNLPIEVTSENDDIAKITNQGITGVSLGKTNLIINMHNGNNPEKIELIVYLLKDQTEGNYTNTNNLTSSINSLIESSLNSDTNIKGIDESTLEAIKENIPLGKEIITELILDEPSNAQKEYYQNTLNNTIPRGYTLLNSYNIVIKLYVDDNYIGNISETPEYIQISIPFLNNVDINYERVFNVIRFHDNMSEILDATYQDGKLTFETNAFSYYAIVYKDKLKTALDDVPKTGDFTLHLMLITIAVVFATCTFWYYRVLYEKE